MRTDTDSASNSFDAVIYDIYKYDKQFFKRIRQVHCGPVIKPLRGQLGEKNVFTLPGSSPINDT